MERPAVDPLVAFAEITTELVGRAVNACMGREAGAIASRRQQPKNVQIELMQSAHLPEEMELRVRDEGAGLPQTQAALKRALAPLERPMANPAIQTTGLLLRTTSLDESLVRRYHVMLSSMNSGGNSNGSCIDIFPSEFEEVKPPGLYLTGTEASVSFKTHMISAEAAVAACEQLLAMLCMLCPPVRLTFKCSGLHIPTHLYQHNDSNTATTFSAYSYLPNELQLGAAALGNSNRGAASPREPQVHFLSFTRHFDPIPEAASLSCMLRLETGLFAEFSATPEIVPSLSQVRRESSRAEAPHPAPSLLTFIGVGEAPVPRGCKWGAYAGVVLHVPDHVRINALAQESHIASEGSNQNTEDGPARRPAAADAGPAPTPVYIFKSHALQMRWREVAAASLRRVDWPGHGFKLLRNAAGGNGVGDLTNSNGDDDTPSASPLEIHLRCEQPESQAYIASILVHYHLQPGYAPGSEHWLQGPPRLAERHAGQLLRGAVDAALGHLKAKYPGVMLGRRERSFARALPVVSSAMAGILLRSVGSGVLQGACAVLEVEPDRLAVTLQGRLEDVVLNHRNGVHRGDEDGATQ